MRSCALLALALVAAVGAPSPVSAQPQRPTVQITPGKPRAFQAAIQRFKDEALPVDPRRADDLRQALADALEFSAVFTPMDPKAFLGEENTTSLPSGGRSDCIEWQLSGADALVEGVIRSESGRLSIEFAVWDPIRCKRLARETLSRVRSEGVRLARQVADEVVRAYTGTRGAAASEIAYVSTRSGRREVYVGDVFGGAERRATNSEAIKAFPQWLRDGEGILYTSYTRGGQPGLFITSRGSARPGPILTRILPGVPKYRGVFSPDGDWMALVASADGAAELYRVRKDGRRLHRLSHSAAIEVAPSWSPDGERIAFVSDRSGAPQIYLMDADGGNVERLTFQGSYNTSPAWSPDGRWIAYETRIGGQFDIWLIDPEGEISFPLVEHRLSDESPAWSPDSRKMAFSSTRRGRADIYVMDVNGDYVQRLTRDAGDNIHPTWGPFVD